MFAPVSRVIVIAVVANESEASDSMVVVVQARVETQLSKKEGGQVTTC